MKASTPSLILYFSACILTVLFDLLGQESLVLYANSIVVPSIFIYYLTTNNYKIDLIKASVFLFSFIGDAFILVNYNDSETGSVLSFLIVYMLLMVHLFQSLKKIKFDRIAVFSLIIVIIALVILSTTILSLQFEKMKTDFSIIIIYSIVLSMLICISVVNYIAKGTFAFLNLLLMSVFFMFSDIFYVLNGFYLKLSVFSLIEMATQVFSYFFMVNYFIANDKSINKLNNN
ncbi:lysoplasmalogenase family protein [Flavobacterium sp. LB1P62]|uniref:lysoplasmalogenase family protein n=1 Tax=Flavobacterium sp. LB1P62 TaxID=3401715 RepID=UPI003AB052D0